MTEDESVGERLSVNDLGGLPVPGGRLREGVLFRISGGLVGTEDTRRLDQAGLRLLVDLRSPEEDRSVLVEYARSRGVSYRNLPISVATMAEALEATRTVDRAARYLLSVYYRIVDEHGEALAVAVSALARANPAGFGCAGGKDRTGLLAALIQSLVGVDRNDILRTYVEHAPAVERLQAAFRDRWGVSRRDLGRPGLPVLLGANEETLSRILDHIEEHHEGVAAYLGARGLQDDDARALREALAEVAETTAVG